MSIGKAHLLGPFADVPLERVLERGVVVQLEEVGESAEIVEEEAEGDETGNKKFQLDPGHPPEQADHVDRETIDKVGQISYFMSYHHFFSCLLRCLNKGTDSISKSFTSHTHIS